MSIPPTAGNNFQCSAAISWILSLGEKFADADETFCARPPCTKWACHEAGTIAAASSYSNITVARYLQFRKVFVSTLCFTSHTELNVPILLGCFDVLPDKVHMPRQLVAERRLPALDQRGLQQRQPRESAGSAAGEHAKARCVS